MSHSGNVPPWPEADRSRTGTPSVWVVDDSALQAKMARDALAAHLDVTVFSSGADVLEKLSAGAAPPALMLLDWHLPDPSGAEVCHFVRASFNSAALPIIIMTASGSSADLLEALSAGANDFVKPPVTAVELNARVDGLLRLTELHLRVSETERKLRLEAVFRERFMATLAHDLRQPLSTVLMGCQLLREASLPAAAAKVVERQHRAAERMQRMVTDLLDSTRHRPESGMPVTKRRTDFAEVARTVVDEMQSAHPDRELRLRTEGVCVGHWDADRLAQILSNLVGNALAHGEVNSRVDVRLSGTDEETVLVVSNRGLPIPDATFDPSAPPSRRSSDVRRASGGFGLGLHIVQHIVQAHGGTLSAESERGETRVIVRLPRAEASLP